MSTITIDRATVEQALEALEYYQHRKLEWDYSDEVAITALRAALAQEQAEPAQEPVAWLQPKTIDAHLRPDLGYETCSKTDYGAFPVYRAPLKAEPAQSLPCPTPETCREHCCGGWCIPQAIKAAEGGK